VKLELEAHQVMISVGAILFRILGDKGSVTSGTVWNEPSVQISGTKAGTRTSSNASSLPRLGRMRKMTKHM